MRQHIRLGATAALATGLLLASAPAHATPGGPGVTAKTLVPTVTVDGKDYTVREITIPPGQGTGWHFHDGVLHARVAQGTLSHFDAGCESDGVWSKGDFLTEPSGSDHVHIGQNRGDTDVVLQVLYVLPHGAPFSQDAPNPGCDFE
ncbi:MULTISPECIES: cupin domain-containing protein [Streptomyces]|uniref:cupin domain-containing protein n=1 Tax=Streptomyces TaxID=1883 RepID=UPI001F29E8B6|nr:MULTISPECIES: cupin domain-containing protein [Streptomyces]MCF2130957.1 cupin domain-containing protein [Streptomyces sp. STD 3.1]WFB88469.1 cupin domain-containing protein [Streptomyces olivaceus]WGK50912.1 cupin domain-containing protein [Streptomyces sp. B146]